MSEIGFALDFMPLALRPSSILKESSCLSLGSLRRVRYITTSNSKSPSPGFLSKQTMERHRTSLANHLSTSTLILVTFSRGDLTRGGDEAFLIFTPRSPLPLVTTDGLFLKTTLGRFCKIFTAFRTLSSSSCTTNSFRQGCTRGINARIDRYMPRSSCECMARGGMMVISVRLGSERSAASK